LGVGVHHFASDGSAARGGDFEFGELEVHGKLTGVAEFGFAVFGMGAVAVGGAVVIVVAEVMIPVIRVVAAVVAEEEVAVVGWVEAGGI
jgi:hypothetical protein